MIWLHPIPLYGNYYNDLQLSKVTHFKVLASVNFTTSSETLSLAFMFLCFKSLLSFQIGSSSAFQPVNARVLWTPVLGPLFSLIFLVISAYPELYLVMEDFILHHTVSVN